MEVGVNISVDHRMGARDLRIDVLKGIGIILVVWGHCVGIFIREIYIFHIPLFFFLSGLFFSSKPNFVWRKMKTLIFPAIGYSIFFFLSVSILGGGYAERFKAFSIYNLAVFDGPLWFLYALFLISVFYYFLFRLVKNSLWRLIFTYAIGIGFVLWDVTLPFYLRQAACSLPFYSTAYFLNQKGWVYTKNKGWIILFVSLFVAAILFYRITHSRVDIAWLWFPKNFVVFYVGALAAIMLMLNLPIFQIRTRVNILLSSIGTESLAIMALHYPFFPDIKLSIVEQHILSNESYNGLFSGITAFILLLSLSYLLSLGYREVKKLLRQNG